MSTLTCLHCGQKIPVAKLVKSAVERGARSVSDIKGKMPIMMDDKEIYNGLAYLTRKKIIRHIGYGQYEPR